MQAMQRTLSLAGAIGAVIRDSGGGCVGASLCRNLVHVKNALMAEAYTSRDGMERNLLRALLYTTECSRTLDDPIDPTVHAWDKVERIRWIQASSTDRAMSIGCTVVPTCLWGCNQVIVQSDCVQVIE